jgi:predicted unusual protein kinase regulating ubiquinone biosynthesis (AarF/ABC1/UbiB family)
MADRIPTGLVRRAAATGRMAASLGKAAARRLVRSSEEDDAHLGESLMRELDRLKGLAMKVGQIVSYMEVGLPEQTAARLAQLQRGLEPLPLEAVRGVIERSLGAPLAELYEQFEPVPVAAASIGQVHRATLRGVPVAVKVRYPGVRETLESDTRQLGAIAKLASLATAVDGPALVAELRSRLLEECDYALEAQHQLEFARLLQGDESWVVPQVHPDRCGPEVLTTTWHDGEPFSALLSADASRRSAVARSLLRLPWTTLLRHGVLHADPHPGNFLFPGGAQVVVLDFGCIRRFDPASVAAFRQLVRVVLAGERSEILAAASAVGLVPRPDKIDVDELWGLLSFMLAPYRTERFSFTRSWWEEGMQRFSSPTARNSRHMAFPPEWMWLQRSLLGLHAVLMRLGAEVEAKPIVTALLEER